MTEPVATRLDEAAASVHAAWLELNIVQGERETQEDEQDRRYIAALWRIQNAEEEYHKTQDEIFRS